MSLCFITFIQVNMDLNYLQDWLLSLQSQYLLFLRSHKDRKDIVEKSAVWVYTLKEYGYLRNFLIDSKSEDTAAMNSLIHGAIGLLCLQEP